MKQLRNTKGTLEALLVIGLILIIPLFFVMKSAAEQNAVKNLYDWIRDPSLLSG